MRKAATTDREIFVINEIQMSTVTFCLLGTTALIMHRFPFKAWQELLFPSARGNRASLEQKLKHDPYNEFRSACYLNRDKARSALFHLPGGMFHGALATAALDHPGAKKAQIERLCKVSDINIDLYGIPEIFCSMVRNSDQNHTPDVRTRPIFPQWACKVTIHFLKSLTEKGVLNLMSAAGKIGGVGDWRGEKGGPYGAFDVVGDDDPRFQQISKTQARAAQQKAYDSPGFYDEDTADILTWFEKEIRHREKGDLLAKNRSLRTRRIIITNGSDEFVGEEDEEAKPLTRAKLKSKRQEEDEEASK